LGILCQINGFIWIGFVIIQFPSYDIAFVELLAGIKFILDPLSVPVLLSTYRISHDIIFLHLAASSRILADGKIFDGPLVGGQGWYETFSTQIFWRLQACQFA